MSVEKIIDMFRREQAQCQNISFRKVPVMSKTTLYKYIQLLAPDTSNCPTLRNARRVQSLLDLGAVINIALVLIRKHATTELKSNVKSSLDSILV